MYDFEIERISRIIKENNYRMVGLQFPEGIKDHAVRVADEISSMTGCLVVISSDPCYGSCDLADEEMKNIGCDGLFHFGHSQILKNTSIPVYYIEINLRSNILKLIEENLHLFPARIGLVSTVQHINILAEVKEFLVSKGFEVHIGKAGGRVKYPGQVLGCSFTTATDIADKVDCFLYIGSGNFHPLGVCLATKKPTLALDPILGEVRKLDEFKEKILRQRYVRIAKAKDANTFGIIIGEKRGQMRVQLALKLKKKLEEKGKRAYLISLREITPEHLISFRKLDALVNTACPRIAIDDAARYQQPMLTPFEVEVLLGEESWEDYRIDQIG
jgi:2-(3-amino-3-carboxypropyl)histidine synthase